jgi:hypothetical protein
MEQRFLLEAEGVRFKGRRVDLEQFEHRFQKPARENPKKAAAQAKPSRSK